MSKCKCVGLVTTIFLILSLGLTGCGVNNADNTIDEEVAQESSPDQEGQEVLPGSEIDSTEQDTQGDSAISAIQPETETGTTSIEKGIELYDYSPVFFNLSEIPAMENKLYAEWDGNIYFRQYSDEDIEKGAVWANFSDIPNTVKELMCLTHGGELIQVGTDYGCGAMYIVNGRLYSQCLRYTDPERETESTSYYVVYSRELDGGDVIEYDTSHVLAVKGEKIICEGDWNKPGLSILDTQTGQMRILVDEAISYLDATEEEIFFYKQLRKDDGNVDDYTYVYDTVIYSVDYEGNICELTTVTVAECADLIDENPEYVSSIQIPCFKILGNDLYFSAGWYAGSANMFQGGAIYSMKKDGSERNVEAVVFNEWFYLYDDGVSRALYCRPRGVDLEVGEMWPMILTGEAPQGIMLRESYASYDEPYVHSSSAYDPLYHTVYPDTSVLLYPDTSGICYVLLTEQDCEELSVDAYVDGHFSQDIKDVEYLGGKLFFTVTDLTYSIEDSIGWRDGYLRGRTACYCKDMKSGEISLLYAY